MNNFTESSVIRTKLLQGILVYLSNLKNGSYQFQSSCDITAATELMWKLEFCLEWNQIVFEKRTCIWTTLETNQLLK